MKQKVVIEATVRNEDRNPVSNRCNCLLEGANFNDQGCSTSVTFGITPDTSAETF